MTILPQIEHADALQAMTSRIAPTNPTQSHRTRARVNASSCGIVKLKAEPLMWPQDVGVISLPERQALGRDLPNSRQLDDALTCIIELVQ
jgi:hypothetical protein